MTVVDDRPAIESAVAPSAPHAERRASSFSTWRFAARLARREVRRRPGRTLLVMLLVAVPVIAMTGASIVARTTSETALENFSRNYGTADAIVYPNFETGPPGLDTAPLPDLPAGTRVTSYVSTYTAVWVADGNGQRAESVQLSDMDLASPIIDGLVVLEDGRLPTEPGEVLLAPDVAGEFGVDVGDRLALLRPDIDLDVVGIGQRNSWFDEPLMLIADFDRDLLRLDQANVETLVDLPDDLSLEQRVLALGDINRTGSSTRTADGFYGSGQGVGARELAWGWVAGVLAFVAVGIVIAAAFATSARRQLVTIGQLASNGAPPRLVSRTMGLQGMWTGLLGVAVGLPVAVIACVALQRVDLVSRFAGRPIRGLEIAPFDFVVIAVTAVLAATLAALVPARSAARIPVLSALAGRRPVATPPKWLAPVGAAIFIGGLLLLAAAAAVETADPGDIVAVIAILGALGVLFGVVCASPLIVVGVAHVGGRRGGVIRLASRSLGRARARSAAVLTAIAVVGIIATVASVVVESAERSDGYFRSDPRVVDVNFVPDFRGAFGYEAVAEPVDGVVDAPPTLAEPLPAVVRGDLERVLPGATWTPISQIVFDPAPYRVDTGELVGESPLDPDIHEYSFVSVADEAVLDVADFGRAQIEELNETGVLVISPFISDEIAISTLGDPIVVDVSGSNELVERAVPSFTENGDVFEDFDYEAVYAENRSALSISEIFVTPEFVAENDLDATVSSYRIETPSDITRAQYDELNETQSFFENDAFVESASTPGFAVTGVGRDGGWRASASYPQTPIPWFLIQVAVAVASLFLVLAVVAIGLSLAAAESRDERDVLLAVGAAPKTLRRVAATKALVLTLGSATVAVPVGYVTMFVITRSIGTSDVTAPFPYAISVALILVIPALAWFVTLAISSVAQRFRPVTASTITTD